MVGASPARSAVCKAGQRIVIIGTPHQNSALKKRMLGSGVCSPMPYCWVLLGVAGCCWVLLGVVGCCWVLLGVVGCCWVLLGVYRIPYVELPMNCRWAGKASALWSSAHHRNYEDM
jgi:hypothetical protein